MLSVLDYLEIRKSHAAGESMNSIAARLGHCQKTVSAVIHSTTGEPKGYTRREPVGYPKLGPFVPVIARILLDDESAPKKQRHTSKRIFERLRDEHAYPGTYCPVRRYVSSLKKSSGETFMRIDHQPGRRMEFDFGQVQIDYPEGCRKTDVLSAVWTYSNCPFLIALPSQRIESILEGMKSAFEFFGCIPREVWWDNPKAVAIEILRGRERTLNPTYATIASHYRFDPLFCMPAKGQEKSDVEQSIFGLERRACTPVPRANDLGDLNVQLISYSMKERDRKVAHDRQTIGEKFAIEKQAAMELPAHPFDACIQRSGIVDKYQSVIFETNRYSVPHSAAFAKVTIKAYTDRVKIVHKGQVVADHVRKSGRHESSSEPEHFLLALERKPAWLDLVPAIRDWQLPESFETLRKKLRELHGPRTGDRQYIRVLQLLLKHPSVRIDTAIQRNLHRTTLTAELIAEVVQKLASSTDANIDSTNANASIPLSESNQQSEVARRVQVPMPDLRRFDQLLSSTSFTPEGHDLSEGESSDEYDPTRAAATVAAASSQNAPIADDAGRVCPALA